MLLTKFDPFKQLKEIEKSLYTQVGNSEGVTAFVPTVNTREGEFAYHVDVDLPGVKKEDIKVDLNKGILTISGERKTKEEIKQEDYYKIETYFGKFSRSFTLPDNVDIENIEAKSDNGVLEIVIPKLKDDVSKKSIEIK
ncbi:heat-shock protein Hsp20 [Aliarcobacter cryaerophilus ATCC 43158]|uniref:Heat-shock protein Hsp20 n=1 Tax=Aliarcobacter cryaerophilus ATCC 43158 TaxID=1032070 RepID=A0AAD0XAD6_9BACT|nr:Hsp20/alpha crystallin family protein [Aliarcobacter cryaerophilus]AYJ81100.1 heat-shock protein Hsp20 [Aliarcobacter cryaerophilus ATCC 43158]PRM98042.1 heat-shock protein Hsp20 [Aliarcobacter cryaerophilus]QCZ23416.1 heat-shock protein Hsp20 [Aliarcobacter cryaerophilus ATCC 43158]